MEPEALFRLANLLALAGWIVLGIGIAVRSALLHERIAGRTIPIVLSLGYAALISVHWWSAEGGFGALSEVSALFRSPWMLLAGWVHYLAFDLFVGAWIAGDAAARGQSRWLLLPVLPMTFLFGPAGFLAWIGIRTAFRPEVSHAR
ncbi:MAG: DUF4281 domain-containing protein [Alphaproteobacteria bacterium]|nr:DUF4281 domain-containing protein [Alphaproteobacteria bacterium]